MKKPTLLLLLSGLLLASTGGLHAAVNITAPAGGETFAPGDRIDITWEVTGDLVGPGVISLRNEDTRRLFYIIKQNVRLRPGTTAECRVPPEILEGRYRAVIRWGLFRQHSSHGPVIHIGPGSGDGGDWEDPGDDDPPGGGEEDPAGLPDLVVNNFEMTPSTPIPGEAVEVQFRVRNIGGTRSGPCKVRWTPRDRAPEIPSAQKSVPPLNPGGDRLIRFNLRGFPRPAPRFETVVMVDGENAVTESDKTNNMFRTEITVAATDGGDDEPGGGDSGGGSGESDSGRPDLVVTDFSLNPRTPGTYEDVLVRFRVRNIGARRAPACEAQWDPAIGPYAAVKRNFEIPALNPGESRMIRYTFRGYPFRRNGLNTKVTVDHEEEITESYEGNNTQRLSFNVVIRR